MSLKVSKRPTAVGVPAHRPAESALPRPHFLGRRTGGAPAAQSVPPLEAPGPAPRSPRYRSLDFWRGAACLLVVVFHSTFYASAANAQAAPEFRSAILAVIERFWIGVPMFFVISGYCISATADAHRRENRSTGDYFARRVRRIAPPYWCALALTFVAVWVGDVALHLGLFTDSTAGFPAPRSLNAWQWIGNLTLSESWRHLIVGGRPSYFLGHAWTLFYEEQFYVVTGLILALAPRRFFAVAALVTAFVLIARRTAPWLSIPVQGAFLDGHWLMFAAGILVYYYVNYASFRRRRICEASLWLWLLHSARDLEQVRALPNTIDSNLLVAAGFALLLVALHRWDAALSGTALTRPFRFCGTICYSLYLVHWPICKAISHSADSAGVQGVPATMLVVVPLCIATSLVAAYAFHIGIERRFLNAKRPADMPPRSPQVRSNSRHGIEIRGSR